MIRIASLIIITIFTMSSFTSFYTSTETFKDGKVSTDFAQFRYGIFHNGSFEPSNLYILNRVVNEFNMYNSISSEQNIYGIMSFEIEGIYTAKETIFDFGFILNNESFGYFELKGSGEKDLNIYYNNNSLKEISNIKDTGHFKMMLLLKHSLITYYIEINNTYFTISEPVKLNHEIEFWCGAYNETGAFGDSGIYIEKITFSHLDGKVDYYGVFRESDFPLMIILSTIMILMISFLMLGGGKSE